MTAVDLSILATGRSCGAMMLAMLWCALSLAAVFALLLFGYMVSGGVGDADQPPLWWFGYLVAWIGAAIVIAIANIVTSLRLVNDPAAPGWSALAVRSAGILVTGPWTWIALISN